MKYIMIFCSMFLIVRCFAMDGAVAFETAIVVDDDAPAVPPHLSSSGSSLGGSELDLSSATEEDVEAIVADILGGNDAALKDAAISTLRGMKLSDRTAVLNGVERTLEGSSDNNALHRKIKLRKRKSRRPEGAAADLGEKAKEAVTADQMKESNALLRELLVRVSVSNKKLNETLTEQAEITKQLRQTNEQLHQDKNALGKTVSGNRVKLWIAVILATGGVVAAAVTGGITALTC